MRAIKFRGEVKSTFEPDLPYQEGDWVYGYYVASRAGEYPPIHRIFTTIDGYTYAVPIIPETVGQYTGLKDENDKEIYEGDIVKFDVDGVARYEANPLYDLIDVVGFERGTVTFGNFLCHFCCNVKKLGNKYDNPELLEE